MNVPKSIFEVEPQSLLVYQIDVTNWCNATCTYCPQPTHARERGYITEQTFQRTLTVMKNRVVSLHHFGEPLLHKGLEKLVSMATEQGFTVGFSSNGKGLTHDHATGKVRELLCVKCNRFVGLLEKDPDLTYNVIEYLEAHR